MWHTGVPVFRNSSFQKVGKWRAVVSLFLLFGCFVFFFFKILKPVVGVRSGEKPVRAGGPAAWCHGISLHHNSEERSILKGQLSFSAPQVEREEASNTLL